MRQDIAPPVWGPKFWATLHAIADAAPEADSITDEEREAYDRLFDALPHLLPCSQCRRNLVEKYRQGLRPGTSGREELRRGVFELHNAVNRSLGRPELEEIDQCSTAYTSGASSPGPAPRRYLAACAVLLVLVGLLASLLFVSSCR